MRMPVLFLSHGGGPCFYMSPNEGIRGGRIKMGKMAKGSPAEQFLRCLASQHGIQHPKAILIISAHLETHPHLSVSSSAEPRQIYDFYGFPEHTYKIKYPAKGSPQLAEKIARLLCDAGHLCKQNNDSEFDHGVWVPLKLMYPDADIPIVQLSLHANLDAETHISVGKSLESLRDEGVLIIGSGMATHNLRVMEGTKPFGQPKLWAREFNSWLVTCITNQSEGFATSREENLLNWRSAPFAEIAHPPPIKESVLKEEHLLPLMVCVGAAGCDKGELIWSSWANQVFALTHFLFGGSPKSKL